MQVDLTPIVVAVIALISAVVSAFVVPWLREKRLYDWVVIAVKAAEQVFKESGMGKHKKEYVLAFLKSKGYSVDTESIDMMIESAVHSLTENLEITAINN